MSETKALTVREQQVATLSELIGGDTAKAEKLWRIAANAVSKTPALKTAPKELLWLAIQDVAAMGLTFGSRGAFLVPHKNKKKGITEVTVIVSPHGLIELMFRHPLVKSVQARVVREGEPFTVKYAPTPRVTHSPTFKGELGAMIGAYAIIELTTGGRVVEWMTRAEVMKVKATSQSARSGYGPWTDWEEEMWRKTVLKRAAKYVPQSEELMRAMDRDDADHDLTGAALEDDDTPPLAAGVAGLKAAMAARAAQREVVVEEVEEVTPTTGADTVDAEDVEITPWEDEA